MHIFSSLYFHCSVTKCFYVYIEITYLRELAVALAALEGPVAAVEAAVGLQVAGGAEALAARAARERLLARVHEHVLLQVRQLREALGARGAPERPLARVHAQVYLVMAKENIYYNE